MGDLRRPLRDAGWVMEASGEAAAGREDRHREWMGGGLTLFTSPLLCFPVYHSCVSGQKY